MRSEYNRKRQIRHKTLVSIYATETGQDKCLKCGHRGSEDNRLEWDHIDPDTKSFNISRCYIHAMSAIYTELAKCRRLCRSCHTSSTKMGRPVISADDWECRRCGHDMPSYVKTGKQKGRKFCRPCSRTKSNEYRQRKKNRS